ncbi:MAG: hypothetical protein U1E76_24635 [Planctomycetota bacterium]
MGGVVSRRAASRRREPRHRSGADARPTSDSPPAAARPPIADLEPKLELRTIVRAGLGRLAPECSPLAPLRYAVPLADRIFATGAGLGFDRLEDLADRGLLARELHDVVPVCAHCRRSEVHQRAHCSACGSLDLDAWRGASACGACGHEPATPLPRWYCRACTIEVDAAAVLPVRIHRYRPTALGARAAELGRLSGLDLASLVGDAASGLSTREQLVVQLHREHARLAQRGIPFATAALTFADAAAPLLRLDALELRRIGRGLRGALEEAALLAQLDPVRLGLLLPDTDRESLASAQARIAARASECLASTWPDRRLEMSWCGTVWENAAAGMAELLAFLDGAPPPPGVTPMAAAARRRTPPRLEPADGPDAPAARPRDEVAVEALGEEDALDGEEDRAFDDLADRFDGLLEHTSPPPAEAP